jgi:hypothetical protein
MLCCLFGFLGCTTNQVYIVSGQGNQMPVTTTDIKQQVDPRVPKMPSLKAAPSPQPDTGSTVVDATKAANAPIPGIYVIIDNHKTVNPATQLEIPLAP